jgi:2,4-diaminopentanoate dehydrogenase
VHNTAPYRVVQWTTGNVGKSSVEAIAKNPNYELVGCYAWSKDTAGRDVGELVGIEPLGVAATNDVAALLALKPDCVVYNRCGSTSMSWWPSCRRA